MRTQSGQSPRSAYDHSKHEPSGTFGRFEKGIARKLDFSYSGAQSLRTSQLLEDGALEIGAVHTYIELYSRLYVDLIPDVVFWLLLMQPDRRRAISTPVRARKILRHCSKQQLFHDGIVIAQVNEIVDDPKDLRRVDIPGSWVDLIVKSDKPFFIEPLFTRDPRQIKNQHVLMGMMALKGIYGRHMVQSFEPRYWF